MADPMSVDELVAKYPDETFRKRLFDLMDIRLLLAECLIGDDYRVSTQMYEPIVLTPLGERIVSGAQKRGVPYPEARMLALLELFHVDIFVDPEKTDIDRLVQVVSQQVASRELLFPFIYGRLLYDKSLDSAFRDNKFTLSSSESSELLRDSPQGVFQVGALITGPYGLLVAPESRYVPPDQTVPFHCSDTQCRLIHRRWLTTSDRAQINEHRSKMRKQIERDGLDSSAWQEYFRRFISPQNSMYNDLAGDPVVYLLGDALNMTELRDLAAWLLDNTGGALRAVAQKLKLAGPAAAIATGLDQAQLLQLALTFTNEKIFHGLDSLVSKGSIIVRYGEVRQNVVSGRQGFGRYELYSELGKYGVRLQSRSTDIAPLRLRRLISQMYRLDVPADRHELEWQLRGEVGDTLESRLEQFLQAQSPRKAVSALLLARRSNMVVSMDQLDLTEETLTTDDDRINAVLWKLGYSVEDVLDCHKEFWSDHMRMSQLVRQSTASLGSSDIRKIQGEAAAYFSELEGLLRDSLLYTTWCLTSNHIASSKPFVYQPHVHEAEALDILREHTRSDVDDDGSPRLTFGDRLTLYPLMRGFQVLADLLQSMEARPEEYLRAEEEFPRWSRLQDIQLFPFNHTVPFLDLLDDSRRQITRRLREISQLLIGADVNEARNDWSHIRRSADRVDRLRSSLDAVRDAVVLIQDNGFSRQVYRRIHSEADEAYRRTVVLADGRGQEVAFFMPSRYRWLRLPGFEKPQHVLISARFHEPMDVLRFTSEEDSPYSQMWANFPARSGRTGPALSRLDTHADLVQ